jgi:hypothetical protein
MLHMLLILLYMSTSVITVQGNKNGKTVQSNFYTETS